MRRTDRPSSTTSTDARAAGWIVSLLLHGTLAFGVFVFAQQITTRSQPVSFTWNVAMVTPPTPATAAPAAPARRSAPAVAQTVKPVPADAEATMRPIEPLDPIARVPIPVSTLPRPSTENLPPPVAEQTALPRTTDHELSRLTPPPHAPTLNAPPQPIPSAPADSVVSTHEQSAAVSRDASLPQQIADTTEQRVAALTPSDHAISTKADYGWLTDLMAKWIGELDKRYPTILRTEGVTGRVTLTALLHQDGILSDVRVVKSSGNTLLDQVAVEDITNGPPVKLSRPLQRPSMPVKFSIVYDLKAAR